MKTRRIPITFLIMCAGLLCHAGLSGQPVPSAVSIETAVDATSGGFYQKTAMNRFLAGDFEAVDSLKVLFVRVSFPDGDFMETSGDTWFGNELRHLREYFIGASNGRFTLVCDLAPEIIPLPMVEAYYGDNESWDLRAAEILMTIVDSLDLDYDFSRWEAFAVIHAGPGKETDFLGDSPWQMSSGFIDPDEMEKLLADTLGTPGVPTDDGGTGSPFYIDNLMILPEDASQDGYIFGSLGIYAYQIGRRLGMIPLYDPTPGDFPDSQGIGSFGLMSYGLYNALGFVPAFPCAFQRCLMGWVNPVTVAENAVVNLADINDPGPGDTILLKIPAGPSEYFLVANRQHDTNLDGRFSFNDLNADGIPDNEDILLGAEFDFFLTGTTDPSEIIDGVKIVDTGGGIKIWHVDERIIEDRLADDRRVNDTPLLKGVDLEEADGVQDLDRPGGAYSYGSHLDSFREGVNDTFAGGTNPSSALNSGIPSGVSIGGISPAGRVMRLRLSFEVESNRISIPVEGDLSGLAPVVADLEGAGDTLLILAAKVGGEGRIYIFEDPCGPSWGDPPAMTASFDSTSWTAGPVACDLDGDGDLEIIITSLDGRIHAMEHDGAPFTIDGDGTPGTLAVDGDVITSALEISADGDPASEAVILSGDGASVHIYVLGLDLAPSDEDYAGPGVGHRVIDGCSRLVSHPARGIMLDNMDGFFFCGIRDEGVCLSYVSMSHDTVFTAIVPESMGRLERFSTGGYEAYADSFMLAAPSSGDLDLDGCDEMVIGLPGIGLVYWDPFSAGSGGHPVYNGNGGANIYLSSAVGPAPSSPALADMDEDGLMETIVRDRERLFILSGFGTILTGWPVILSSEVMLLEESGYPVQPLAADPDGDGELEAIFNVAGDIYVLERSGRPASGWPVRGEGDHSVPFAAARGDGGRLHLFAAGGMGDLSRPQGSGLTVDRDRSSISRVDIQAVDMSPGGWRMWRRDAGGSGRQDAPLTSDPASDMVDDRSFICYPNPVSRENFTVRISISGAAKVSAFVLDLNGEKLASAGADNILDAGMVPFEVQVPVQGIASGIYICRVEVTGEGWRWSGARKIAIVR